MDKVKLFNELVKISDPADASACMIDSLDTRLEDLEMDSLDFIMLSSLFYAAYRVPTGKDPEFDTENGTVGDMYLILEEVGTAADTVEEAVELAG